MLEPLEVEIRTLHAILGSEQDPDGRAFAPLADAYRRAGQPRKAFGLVTDGISRLPDFASGHVVAARLYAEQGLLEEGEMAARRALELDPENVSALAVLVRVLDARGQPEEAEDAYRTLEALEPEVLEEESVRRPEPVMDVTALAPEDDEPVRDVAALAPEEDEPALDIAALAPEADETVLDIAALAPEDDEPALDIAALAPEDEEPVLDVAALAPESDEVALDIAALAPEAAEPTLDFGDLAPEGEEPALDIAALAPEAPEPSSSQEDPEPEEEPAVTGNPGGNDDASGRFEGKEGAAPRIYTRTLGELYAKQGFVDRAVEVFRQLKSEHPDDQELANRLQELEARLEGASEGRAEETTSADASSAERARARDEELEALARDLAEHRQRQPDIDTPFAWTASEEAGDDVAGDQDDGPTIGSYFDELLSYQPREGDA